MIRGAERLSLGRKSGTLFYRRFDSFLRAVFPPFFIIVATFIITGVISPAGKESLVFAVTTGTVYFWSIYRPASMAASTVFFVGLVIEVLNFSPPGTMLFSLLIVHAVANMWRYGLRSMNFILIWALLFLLALLLSVLEWIVSCITMSRGLPLYPAFFQAVVTAGIYPLLAALFGWSRRIVVDDDTI